MYECSDSRTDPTLYYSALFVCSVYKIIRLGPGVNRLLRGFEE